MCHPGTMQVFSPAAARYDGDVDAEAQTIRAPARSRAAPLRRLARRLTIALVVTFLAIPAIGIVAQAICTVRDRRLYPPPGQLVDVGGYRLHLYCVGQGSPTAVLISGVGSDTHTWALVQKPAANVTRVCTYDRAGMGWSDAAPVPRDSRYAAARLRALLRNARIAPPYVLVGHSLGALHARIYASDYPQDVAGLVLVDGAVPQQWLGTNEQERAREQAMSRQYCADRSRDARVASWAVALGTGRLYFEWLHQRPRNLRWLENYPVSVQDSYIASLNQPKVMQGIAAEWQGLVSSAQQVQSAVLPRDLPVVVLAAGLHRDLVPRKPGDRWFDYQKQVVRGSTNSLFMVAERSDHRIPAYQPELVVDAVQKVVEAARSGARLRQLP
jgi:pimeloyl-ACP methyl ester carboxylesterase